MSDRRDRIVDAATELFNQQGVGPVTTNHVAAAMGISPGSLYYHFANKEAIVRAIYERAIAEYDGFWGEVAEMPLDPETMSKTLDGVFSHQWKYRCLQRELPVLVRQDPELADRYREMQTARRGFYRALCERWMDAGALSPMTDAELDDLVTATWLIGESWLGYLEAMGYGDDQRELRRGAQLVLTALRPYLEDGAGIAGSSERDADSSPL